MVLASSSEVAINPHLYKLDYDTVKDLTPVAMVASTPIVVVVNPSLPIKSIPDLIAYAKANPGSINVASAGNGSITHLSGELFKSMTKVSWAHVPYKGAAPALTDLLGGRVQVMFSALPAAMPMIKGERLRAIAVSTRARSPGLPDVPTISASGVPDYDVMFWYGIFVPSATPRDIVTKLYDATAEALKSQDVINSLAEQGAVPGAMTQPQFAEFVKAELATWGKVVKESGAKVD
jgi:tripartite-type tricarboxylate transporter receptor subunit TctC